ncbi:hypothetical protein [Nocardia sp. NBC_01327]|uniref:hypothetical protein n=1 Tax=Nocardia sp. NBC_01327 TaxID=2903593 RepID=UPI002E0DC0D3|nr:hypothetical protein OG326_41905 [Nocardia sp. NBC_01327]
MSALAQICDYCRRGNPDTASSCAHCGAPLSDKGFGHSLTVAGEAVAGAAVVAGRVEKAAAKTGGVVADTVKALEGPFQQWRAAIVGIVAIAVVAVVILHLWSPGLPPIGGIGPVEALPDGLRSAAVCRHGGSAAEGDQCVIPSTDSLLAGGIGSGRDLPVAVRVDSANRLSEDLRQWRSAGPAVVADGAVFLAISPAWEVWYADARSGSRIETGSFASSSGARTFLRRSGLLR